MTYTISRMNKFLILLSLVLGTSCAVNTGTKTIHPYSGGSTACGNFVVYKLTEDETEFVSLKVDMSSIDLVKTQTYGIGKAEVVSVFRKKYASSVSASLCNDVMIDKPELLLEEAASNGLVELSLTAENLKKAKNKQPYHVTVIFKDVIFESMVIDYLQLDNVIVGFLPG